MHQSRKKSFIYMTLSALSFALMALMVKYASDVPQIQKVFVRNLISVFIALYYVRNAKVSLFGKKESRWLLFIRASTGLIGVILYFYSVEYMNLADSSMLNRLSPFFVLIVAAFMLGEKIKKIHIPALIVVFIASLLIIKPKFDISILPALAGLASAAISGLTYTTVRKLTYKEHPATIVFYFSFFSVMVMAPMLVFTNYIPNLNEIIYLVLIGIFAAGGQFGMTYAYKYGPAGEASLYSYLNVVFAAFLGYLFWNETPDIYSIIGTVLIISTSFFLYLNEHIIIKTKK